MNKYFDNLVDDSDDIEFLKAVAKNKKASIDTKIKALRKIEKIRNVDLGEEEESFVGDTMNVPDEDEITKFVKFIAFRFGFLIGLIFNILVKGLKQMKTANGNVPLLINKEDKEKDEYIDENKTYSFVEDSEETIYFEKDINVDKNKEEDFNKFIKIKSFLSNQLKGDVAKGRIDSAILILEKKFKSNLDLIYKGSSSTSLKQKCLSDNDTILSTLKDLIDEYNKKAEEILKEKEEELIEDSFLQIKKCLDISILSKSSC